jgi:hypothetical protein
MHFVVLIDENPPIFDITAMGEQYINISWMSSSLNRVSLATYNLTISHGSSSQVILVTASQYLFTAPEGAPPCEIYNFSVAATYVGATYTGAGCSVPSPVISTMLPSLPDINYLSDSISYHLVKLSQGLTLNVYFEVRSYIILDTSIVSNLYLKHNFNYFVLLFHFGYLIKLLA